VNEDAVPRIVRYLPHANEVRRAPTFVAEVLVVLDVGDRQRIGESLVRRLIPTHRTVNIDHHTTRKPFADVNWVLPEACATSEMLFDLFVESGEPVDREMAECLYAGIIGDTGNFRFSNTTARAHQIAAELLLLGVQPHRAYQNIYGSRTAGQVLLLSRVLETLRRTEDGRVAWLTVTQAMLAKTGTTLEDVDGFSDYARSVEGVEVVAFFGELEDGRTKVSLRSRNEGVQVDGVAESFGGGGHPYAAGCILDAPHGEAEALVVGALRSLLGGVPGTAR
jgi:phosphoesterase RecJ-like protein